MVWNVAAARARFIQETFPNDYQNLLRKGSNQNFHALLS